MKLTRNAPKFLSTYNHFRQIFMHQICRPLLPLTLYFLQQTCLSGSSAFSSEALADAAPIQPLSTPRDCLYGRCESLIKTPSFPRHPPEQADVSKWEEYLNGSIVLGARYLQQPRIFNMLNNKLHPGPVQS